MKFTAMMLAVLIALVPLTVFAEGKDVNIAVDDEAIVYMGRWNQANDGRMRGSFECGLVLRFTGTSIRLSGKASGTALIAVDGGEVQVKSLKKDAVLFEHLDEGEHTLELYAATQRAFPAISGFALNEGASVLPTQKGKIIEFVGDSIMEGYVNPNDAGDFGANSYRNSYGFLTGRRLMQTYGMQFNTIAYGGIRIVERGDGDTKNDPLGMPERYFLAREWNDDGGLAKSRAAVEKWDTSRYAPDYIVINLGTNDRSGDPSRIRAEFYKYLKNLNTTYPNALVFVMTPFIGGVNEHLTAAVALAHNDNNILIDTTSWEIPAGYDNCHPAPAAHERAAELLFDTLKPYIEGTQAGTPTDTPTETPTETPDGTVTDAPTDNSEQKGSFDLLPYVVGGAIVLAAAIAVVIAAVVSKKRKA